MQGLALVQINSIGVNPVYVDPSLLNIKPVNNSTMFDMEEKALVNMTERLEALDAFEKSLQDHDV
jgi:hypothetical protein